MSDKETGRWEEGVSGANQVALGGHFKTFDKCFGVRRNYFKTLFLLLTTRYDC